MTRGFHNPYLKEKAWERTFDRRLPAVVPMDYRYLAKYDGSEMALGRGRGQDKRTGNQEGRGEGRKQQTPYMHMTFHPLERRLDTAIWRALFASSVKQARQFVVHGGVKVNGKQMRYPGYQLNPGDMFSVDPDKVMYATGARKYDKEVAQSRQHKRARKEAADAAKQAQMEEQEGLDGEDSEAGAATLESDEEREAMSKLPELHDDPKEALKSLVVRAQRVLGDSKRKLSGKRQQELREFSRSIRKTMSKLRGIEEDKVEETIEGLETGLAEILTKIPQDDLPRETTLDTAADAAERDQETDGPSSNKQMQDGRVDNYRARKDAELLHAALERARENPIDASKPYATPWQPRDYMSAFAFIPRYLEVNQNICSAVYLRHPVARPGLAEVPTPFHGETLGLAFNWYLRRR